MATYTHYRCYFIFKRKWVRNAFLLRLLPQKIMHDDANY